MIETGDKVVYCTEVGHPIRGRVVAVRGEAEYGGTTGEVYIHVTKTIGPWRRGEVICVRPVHLHRAKDS